MILNSAFVAMGNTAIVELDAASTGLFPVARSRIEMLESTWSRFSPSSDISRLNEAAGKPVFVDPATITLIQMMQRGYATTHGLFNPSILPNVIAAGYERSLTASSSIASSVASLTPSFIDSSTPSTHAAAQGLLPALVGTPDDIVVSDLTVTLPHGMLLDPGAVGKGLAADLVLQELLSLGATEVCVSLGGDIAFAGAPRRIDVLSPFNDAPLAAVAFERGGVATSSTLAKKFLTSKGSSHHVIDPRTGIPLANGIVQATVLASSCGWAEILATASLISGNTELVDSLSIGALLVSEHGDLLPSRHWSSL